MKERLSNHQKLIRLHQNKFVCSLYPVWWGGGVREEKHAIKLIDMFGRWL